MKTKIACALVVISLVVPGCSSPGPDKSAAKPELPPGVYQQGREFRKDFNQSFPFNANGRFSIEGVNGRIEIHGWNSNLVVLTAVIHGKTAARVAPMNINVNFGPSRAAVRTVLPPQVHNLSGYANVDYTVRLPLHARLENVSTVDGVIIIDGMAEDITASTVNGSARAINAAGSVKLTTVNGNLTAEMDKLGVGQSVDLATVNGTIHLAVPDNADAKFSINTANGSVNSDFPELPARRHFPMGGHLTGSLGNGAATVSANAVNGTIDILKDH